MERLRHPEYDALVAALNAQRQDTLDALDVDMEMWLDARRVTRRLYARFLRRCRSVW